MLKQTKAQVLAEVRKTGKWAGYIVGSKVAEYHVKGGWHLGYPVELYLVEGRGVCVVGQETCEHAPTADDPYRHAHFPRTFSSLLDNWAYYNANNETGTYAAFYKV